MLTSLPEPALRTARLEIRLARMADADAILAGLNDFAVSSLLAKVPHPYTRADAEAWIALTHDRLAAGTSWSLIIADGARAIGGIGLSDVPSGRPTFGYWLARGQWGKGYATEAGRALLAHAFDHLGSREIISHVYEANAASLHVQDKLGFQIVGRSTGYCLARKADLPHIDTALASERYRFLAQ